MLRRCKTQKQHKLNNLHEFVGPDVISFLKEIGLDKNFNNKN